MSFPAFLDRVEGTGRTLAVVNRAAPEPILGMLEDVFSDQPVSITDTDLPGYDDDTVLLLQEGEVVASSPLSELADTILLVNGDLYTTGSVGLDEVRLPAVLAELTDTRFSLRGYPESNSEKVVLILISRYIELLSWQHGGRHRASFQRLSRINDERGTRGVYERLADGGPDTHVYGIPDWTPPLEFDVTIHGSHDADLQRTWFVIFLPPRMSDFSSSSVGPSSEATGGETDERQQEGPAPAALLAYESAPRQWDAFWTRDPVLVGDLNRYIECSY